jgi:hypothetical protein
MQCFKQHLVVSLQRRSVCLLLIDVSRPFEVHQLDLLLLKIGLQTVNQGHISLETGSSYRWLSLSQRGERLSGSRTTANRELGRVECRVSLVLVWLSRLSQW